ncbi:TPA: hypothetical protein HA241_00115 [Candidatus Woesearchaeota archaeon]|nr:hypothetical protein [Candidatus Woesearchaeota archaeon]
MSSLAMMIWYEQSTAGYLAAFFGDLASLHNHHKREEEFSTQELVEYLAHAATMMRASDSGVVREIRKRDGSDCLRITNLLAAGVLLRTKLAITEPDLLLDQMYERYGLGSEEYYSLSVQREQRGVIVTLSRNGISSAEQLLESRIEPDQREISIQKLETDLTAATGPMMAMGRDLFYPKDQREKLIAPTSVRIESRYGDSIDVDRTLSERVVLPVFRYIPKDTNI